MTLNDRVNWTNENMEVILELGKELIIVEEAEKAISFLACCVEWFDYQTAIDEGRTPYSSLPIPVDGSNNGWQHLGAISKDTHTGSLVGLTPVDIQQDFYVQTAKKLSEITTHEERSEILQKMPMKHIRKGISKRGSMTRAYSAGASKIGENMYFDCKAEDYHDKYGIDEKHCLGFAKDLIKSINMVCPGPLDTMKYLQQLAKFEIGEYTKYKDGVAAGPEYKELRKEIKELFTKKDKDEGDLERLNELVIAVNEYESELVYGNGSKHITWATPSGFPVKYESYKMKSVKCVGRLNGQYINHVGQIPTKTPDVRGFMCGISPNFIHSMDASHMALVINDWDGDFGAVHDSFSTHADDEEELLVKTKNHFIDIYDVDNFYNYIEDQLLTKKDNLDVTQPTLGDLNIQEVYDSDYFFA